MQIILKQALYLFVSLLLLYGLILGGVLLFVPLEHSQMLDSAFANKSLYTTEPKYVFLSRKTLDNDVNKVILLGASNVVAGFRPKLIEHDLPGVQVHNLGVGGANVTEVGQIVDLVLAAQTHDAQKHNIFVLGIWYGLMADDKARWYTADRVAGDTDIDIERYRYGFYGRGDSGPIAILPPNKLSFGLMLIHPYLVLDRGMRYVNQALHQHMANNGPELTDKQRNTMTLSDDQKQSMRVFWDDYMGRTHTISAQSFIVLQKIIETIVMSGGRVVIADMPLPRWHKEHSPYFSSFDARKQKFIASLEGKRNISFLELQDLDDESSFQDEVHPKPFVQPFGLSV